MRRIAPLFLLPFWLCSACTSMQWAAPDGRARSLGWARIERKPDDQNVERILAPGLSLRLLPGLLGYAIGWRETVLLYAPVIGRKSEIAAFEDSHYGIAIAPWSISIGASQTFAVLEPTNGDEAGMMQSIVFEKGKLNATSIRRLEVR